MRSLLELSPDEERKVRHALMDLPKVCRYHGVDFSFLGNHADGTPRCESCRIPWRSQQAWRAYNAALDRRDEADQNRAQAVRRLAEELRDA